MATALDHTGAIGAADRAGLQPSLRRDFWSAVSSTTEGRVAAVLILVVAAIVLFGGALAPYSPTAIGVGAPLSGPSRAHLLGTDALGRDVLSRVLTGGTVIIVLPFVAVTIAQILGGALGMIGAYVGGLTDALITRVFDVLLTVPPLLMVLVLIAALGTSDAILVGTVALVFAPRAGRVIRGTTQGVIKRDYILAARMRGEPAAFVVAREILPNIAGPFLADFALKLTYGIIFVATLNFLGLGVQPPAPDWAVMISEGQPTITVAPLAVLAPAVALALLSVGVNLLGDALARVWSRQAPSAGGAG